MKYVYCISTVQIPLDSSLSQNRGMIFLRQHQCVFLQSMFVY